jgi:NAD(P)-dependent dehydrogenase (short-subunit alcohol dehydrogenase family)
MSDLKGKVAVVTGASKGKAFASSAGKLATKIDDRDGTKPTPAAALGSFASASCENFSRRCE